MNMLNLTNEKAKVSLVLLVICVITAVMPSAIWPESEWADIVAFLAAFGAVISFFATLVAVFDGDDTEGEDEE